ncbi:MULTISPECIES: hypothetical protein [Staphylococcus]|uniref:Uncharacterized protein n=1 Tax=Staphylococcus shinii TaxID=2912228 RepID=A0A418IF21_9STAP|nr:hypothetical protein [Staphylococcus shinii]MDW8564874.1 hypothetical protein [Staphylococcus shinii]MDW8568112.1 hypothetical protein [Staphylococcus shinii]MEC5300258.1 hypothetical protein [Staphylococcus shinii]OEK83440.1 hypothetical protein AST15_13330 [Staphylococcus shinii]QRA15622.1 hypothetical protein JMB28_08155 [Staphylococcus shinii]
MNYKKELDKIGWNKKEVKNRVESLIEDEVISEKEDAAKNIEDIVEKENNNSTLNEFLNK